MQSIRRATRKHRKVLLGVVILLMLGLVGSFATWNSASRAIDGGGDAGDMTLAQQISSYEAYIDNMLKDNNNDPDYSISITLASSYLDLSYLYRNKASEDVSAAQAAADAAAAEAEAKGLEAPEAVDTYAAGAAAQGASLTAAQQAQAYYQRAWDIAPEGLSEVVLADIKSGLAASREAQDDLEGALAFLNEAYELSPSNTQYLVGLATLLETMGRPEEALEKYDTLAALYPDNTQVILSQAGMLAELGREGDAEEHYQKACELAPEDLNAAYAYASFLLSYGSPEAGLAKLQAFRDSLPEGHATIAEADNAIANLSLWADFFSSLSGGAGLEEEGTEGEGETAE